MSTASIFFENNQGRPLRFTVRKKRARMGRREGSAEEPCYPSTSLCSPKAIGSKCSCGAGGTRRKRTKGSSAAKISLSLRRSGPQQRQAISERDLRPHHGCYRLHSSGPSRGERGGLLLPLAGRGQMGFCLATQKKDLERQARPRDTSGRINPKRPCTRHTQQK